MGNRIKSGFNSIKDALKYFFLELLGGQSTRIQLVWFSAFSWATAHLWYGITIPLVREVSIIYYRQNGIVALPVDMNSPYAQTILSSTDMAFTAIVVTYVISNYKRYGNQVKEKDIVPGEKKNNEEVSEEK